MCAPAEEEPRLAATREPASDEDPAYPKINKQYCFLKQKKKGIHSREAPRECGRTGKGELRSGERVGTGSEQSQDTLGKPPGQLAVSSTRCFSEEASGCR